MSDFIWEPSPRTITDALTAFMLIVRNHQWDALFSWFHPQAVTLLPTGQILAANRDACVANLRELVERDSRLTFFSAPPVIQVVESTAVTIVHYHIAHVQEYRTI